MGVRAAATMNTSGSSMVGETPLFSPYQTRTKVPPTEPAMSVGGDAMALFREPGHECLCERVGIFALPCSLTRLRHVLCERTLGVLDE